MAKMKPKLKPHERVEAEKELQAKLTSGSISIGQAIREIRQRFAGLTIEDYARMIGMSKTTLLSIEQDDSRVLRDSIEKAIEPLGYKLTLVKSDTKNNDQKG